MKKIYPVIFAIILFNSAFAQNRNPVVINDGYGDYILIPAGEFQMGDNFGKEGSAARPVHKVNLDAYYIGKYEVSNSDFKKFIDDGGYTTESYWTKEGWTYKKDYSWSQPKFWKKSKYKGGGIAGNENFPVVGVSWYEASAYCAWLSAKTGKTYRLPTEAEWEKAARGDIITHNKPDSTRKFPWGNKFDGSYANYWDSGDTYDNGLTPVGYFDGTVHDSFSTSDSKSPYGIYDMAGNVTEWCSDWRSFEYYSKSPTNNPTGPVKGSKRVYRGGGFTDNEVHLQSTYRYRGRGLHQRDYTMGFRCACEN